MRDPGVVAELLTGYADRVDQLCIHLPDELGRMPLKPKAEAIDAFRTVPNVQWMAMGKAVDAPGRVNTWEPVDRAGSLVGQGLPLVRHVGPIRCSYTPDYSHNVMMPNGDTFLCCMDYGNSVKLGNLFTQHWDDLDRTTIRDANMSGGDTICRRCNGAEAA